MPRGTAIDGVLMACDGGQRWENVEGKIKHLRREMIQ